MSSIVMAYCLNDATLLDYTNPNIISIYIFTFCTSRDYNDKK